MVRATGDLVIADRAPRPEGLRHLHASASTSWFAWGVDPCAYAIPTAPSIRRPGAARPRAASTVHPYCARLDKQWTRWRPAWSSSQSRPTLQTPWSRGLRASQKWRARQRSAQPGSGRASDAHYPMPKDPAQRRSTRRRLSPQVADRTGLQTPADPADRQAAAKEPRLAKAWLAHLIAALLIEQIVPQLRDLPPSRRPNTNLHQSGGSPWPILQTGAPSSAASSAGCSTWQTKSTADHRAHERV